MATKQFTVALEEHLRLTAQAIALNCTDITDQRYGQLLDQTLLQLTTGVGNLTSSVSALNSAFTVLQSSVPGTGSDLDVSNDDATDIGTAISALQHSVTNIQDTFATTAAMTAAIAAASNAITTTHDTSTVVNTKISNAVANRLTAADIANFVAASEITTQIDAAVADKITAAALVPYATSASVSSALTAYAQLAGATFTGAVNVPAGGAGNNAIRASEIDTKISSATGALDTSLKAWVGSQGFITALALTGYTTQSWADNRFLKLAGGTLTGALTLAGEPSNNAHAATKQYVDTLINNMVPKTGGTMSGTLVLSGAPTADNHAATKKYVDDISFGNVDLSSYATQAYVDNAIAAIPEVDLSSYATQAYVDNAIAAIPEVDLSGYATTVALSNEAGLRTSGDTSLQAQLDVLNDALANLIVLRSGSTMTGALGAQQIDPTADNTYSLGTAAARWSNLHAMQATIYGPVSANGALTASAAQAGGVQLGHGGVNAYLDNFGGGNIDLRWGNATSYSFQTSRFVPQTDATLSLGAASNRWSDLHAMQGTIHGDLTLSTSGWPSLRITSTNNDPSIYLTNSNGEWRIHNDYSASNRLRFAPSGGTAIDFLVDGRVELPNKLVVQSGGITLNGGDLQVAAGLVQTTEIRNFSPAGQQERIVLNNGNSTIAFYINDSLAHATSPNIFRPGVDNSYDLGFPTFRWKAVYAVNGTIQTSDASFKSWEGPLTEADFAAFSDVFDHLGKFRWTSSFSPNDQRIRFGLQAQDALSTLQAHGYDPFDFGLIDGSINPDTGAVENFGLEYSQFAMLGVALAKRNYDRLEEFTKYHIDYRPAELPASTTAERKRYELKRVFAQHRDRGVTLDLGFGQFTLATHLGARNDLADLVQMLAKRAPGTTAKIATAGGSVFTVDLATAELLLTAVENYLLSVWQRDAELHEAIYAAADDAAIAAIDLTVGWPT